MTYDEFYEKMGISASKEKPDEPKRMGRPPSKKQVDTVETETTVETEN